MNKKDFMAELMLVMFIVTILCMVGITVHRNQLKANLQQSALEATVESYKNNLQECLQDAKVDTTESDTN